MAKKYEFTKVQLIKAFNKWNEDCLNDPNDFYDIKWNSGKEQADVLIKYLYE